MRTVLDLVIPYLVYAIIRDNPVSDRPHRVSRDLRFASDDVRGRKPPIKTVHLLEFQGAR